MFLEEQITSFEKYWSRRKPTSSTAVHYASDVRIFLEWAQGSAPESITVHHVDEFIEWQRECGRGKRGGARVIYDWAAEQDHLLMLFIYAKNESADLT